MNIHVFALTISSDFQMQFVAFYIVFILENFYIQILSFHLKMNSSNFILHLEFPLYIKNAQIKSPPTPLLIFSHCINCTTLQGLSCITPLVAQSPFYCTAEISTANAISEKEKVEMNTMQ